MVSLTSRLHLTDNIKHNVALYKTLSQDTVLPSFLPSSSSYTTSTMLSSTKTNCGNFEYKNTDNFEADIYLFRSTTLYPSTTTEHKGEDIMDDTITSLKDLKTKELGSQQGALSLADSSHNVSDEGVSDNSTTNTTCDDDEEMSDAAEQPFLTKTLRVLKAPLNECGGVGPMGTDNDGTYDNDESLSASNSGAMAVDDTTTQQVLFSLETNAADAELAETIHQLGHVPIIFSDDSDDGSSQTYKVAFKWAINTIGPFEFEQDDLGPRKVLRKDSDLRLRGLAAGLKPEMLAWLMDSSAPDSCVFDSSTFVTEDKSAITYLKYLDMYRPGWQ